MLFNLNWKCWLVRAIEFWKSLQQTNVSLSQWDTLCLILQFTDSLTALLLPPVVRAPQHLLSASWNGRADRREVYYCVARWLQYNHIVYNLRAVKKYHCGSMGCTLMTKISWCEILSLFPLLNVMHVLVLLPLKKTPTGTSGTLLIPCTLQNYNHSCAPTNWWKPPGERPPPTPTPTTTTTTTTTTLKLALLLY